LLLQAPHAPSDAGPAPEVRATAMAQQQLQQRQEGATTQQQQQQQQKQQQQQQQQQQLPEAVVPPTPSSGDTSTEDMHLVAPQVCVDLYFKVQIGARQAVQHPLGATWQQYVPERCMHALLLLAHV
jgi:hypothetical protein